MQGVREYPRLQHRRIRPLRVLLVLLPGVLAFWLFASPVAMADDPIAGAAGSATDATTTTAGSATDAVANTAPSASETVDNTAGSATQTVNNMAGSATNTVGNTVGSTTNTVGSAAGSATGTVGNTAGSATGTVGNTAGSATNTVGEATGSAGQTAADVSGSLMPSLAGQAPTPLALARERHVPQMCTYLPSSFLSELALVSLALDDGSLSVPILGLGEVPVVAVAIVTFLAMMMLAIIAKAWVSERRRQPAFLPVSDISRGAEPERRQAL
jgi:hypothetical protein